MNDLSIQLPAYETVTSIFTINYSRLPGGSYFTVDGLVSHLTADEFITGNILFSINNTIHTTDFTGSKTKLVTTVQLGNLSISSLSFSHVNHQTLLILLKDNGKLLQFDRVTNDTTLIWDKEEKILSYEVEPSSSTTILLGTDTSLEWFLYPLEDTSPSTHSFQVEKAVHVHQDVNFNIYALDNHYGLHLYSVRNPIQAANVIADIPSENKTITDMVALGDEYLILMDSTDNELILFNTTSHLHFNIALQTSIHNPVSLMTYNNVIYIGGGDSISCMEINVDTRKLIPISCIKSLTTTSTAAPTTTTTASLSTLHQKVSTIEQQRTTKSQGQTTQFLVKASNEGLQRKTTPLSANSFETSTKLTEENKIRDKSTELAAINTNVKVNVDVKS